LDKKTFFSEVPEAWSKLMQRTEVGQGNGFPGRQIVPEAAELIHTVPLLLRQELRARVEDLKNQNPRSLLEE